MTMMRPEIEVLADALARLVRDAPKIASSQGTMALFFADVRLVAGMIESGWDAELMENVQECLRAQLDG
jgi:hypothetical protein